MRHPFLSTLPAALLALTTSLGAPALAHDDLPTATDVDPLADRPPELLRPSLLEWSSDGVTLAPYALLQSQAAIVTGDDNLLENGDPAQREGFRMRRARFGLVGALAPKLSFEVSAETAADDVQMLDAWIGYRLGTPVGLVLGARKVPFSRFALHSASDGALIDRPLAVQAMAPFRLVGLTLEGTLSHGLLKYALGAYNGPERRANFHEGYANPSGFEGNRFDRLAYVARVDVQPLGDVGPGLPDFERGDFVFGVGGSFFFGDGYSVETTAWEADLVMKARGWHFVAEAIFDSATPSSQPNTPTDLPAGVDRRAFVAETGYLLLGDLLGATVRAELIDDHTGLEDAGDQLVVQGGLQVYLNRHFAKLQLDYIHRSELHGPSLDNDTLLLQLQLGL